jgi:hypothetical protein
MSAKKSGRGGGSYVVSAEHANDLAAAIELDEQPLVEILRRKVSKLLLRAGGMRASTTPVMVA